jgi:hypothetical protein
MPSPPVQMPAPLADPRGIGPAAGAPAWFGRGAIERALDEGSQRQFAPRQEAQLLDLRRATGPAHRDGA